MWWSGCGLGVGGLGRGGWSGGLGVRRRGGGEGLLVGYLLVLRGEVMMLKWRFLCP